MIVVDIRNFFMIRNVQIIEIGDDCIYYAEEKIEEGHNNLFLLEYNRTTGRERVVTNYSLEDPTFVQHLYPFERSILLVLENGGSGVFVIQIDKKTGEEMVRKKLHCIGKFSGLKALDDCHVLVYTVESEEFSSVFKDYKELTGSSQIVTLYDLLGNTNYIIKNSLLCRLPMENIHLYQKNGQPQALLLDPYGTEALKERCYRESRWINIDIRDNVWSYPLESLIADIKNEEKKIHFHPVLSAGIEGMVRFIGSDKSHLYFRAASFEENRENVCSFSKSSGKIEVVAELPGLSAPKIESYFIASNPFQVYKIKVLPEAISIQGVVRSKLSIKYDKAFGELVGCIEDRFIICQKTVVDSTDCYDYQYLTIYDSVLHTEESFECKCAIAKDTVILY